MLYICWTALYSIKPECTVGIARKVYMHCFALGPQFKPSYFEIEFFFFFYIFLKDEDVTSTSFYPTKYTWARVWQKGPSDIENQ